MMEKLSSLDYASQLIKKEPSISPQEMLHNLHCNDYSPADCIAAIYHFFPDQSADSLCLLSVVEFKHPLIKKEVLQKILEDLKFSKKEIEAALTANYPLDTHRYAVRIGTGRLTAAFNTHYNVGLGDFTVEAWIKPDAGGGTIVSRKSSEGGRRGRGGFLLVLKHNGTIKLATDDGFGFYEINSTPVEAYDGKFHHILGLRRNCALELYFDFKKIEASPRTDRYAQLDINNSLSMALGYTEQMQEQFNQYSGLIGEVRIWDKAKTYTSKTDWLETDYISAGCIGMWTFDNKKGDDYSPVGNPVSLNGVSFETWNV